MRQADKKLNKPDKVLVFGVFDLLHPGHKYFLRQAKKHGKHLTVVVARDNVVYLVKGQRPNQNQTKRRQQIKKLKFVYRAVLGNLSRPHHYQMVKNIKPDVICLGYDQKPNLKQVKQELKKAGLNPKFIRLKSYQPHKFKSSLIKTLAGKQN
ncbi:MAG: adenylyltransferase/cytidyltransferase family protein [Patescibacteria group bacterium]